MPIVTETQVHDVFPVFRTAIFGCCCLNIIVNRFLVLRVVGQTALTNNTIVPGNVDSIHSRGRGRSTSINGVPPDDNLTGSTVVYGKAPGEFGHSDGQLASQ